MAYNSPERIAEFRRRLKELVTEFEPAIEVGTGYYDEADSVDFCLGGIRVVNTNLCGDWDFDDCGHKSIRELKS